MSPVKTLSLIATLAIAVSAPAQQKTRDGVTTGPEIVVTGVSLKDAQAALAACLARQCAPDKDIDATLAVAETQFVSGDYQAARTTMLKSIARNHRFAAAYPVPVSDLLRANSRVAAHLGEQASYFSGALDVVSALKAGLPATDWRVLGAQVELADAFAKTGRVSTAMELYHKVAGRAHALNLPRVEGYALLRVATVSANASYTRDDGYHDGAIEAADVLIARTEPGMAPFVQAAKLLKAKLLVKRGDPGAVDRLIATYRDLGAGKRAPVLLYAPKIELHDRPANANNGGETLALTLLDDVDDQWVDVAFEVQPDGKVGELDVLRKSDKLSGDWVKPILTAIAGRRYAPLADAAVGTQRIERYTFTSAWTQGTGTHLRVRSARPQIEMVDLSRDAVTTRS